MNYRDLKEQLDKLSEEQLSMDVTVYVSGVGEFYGLVGDYPFCISEDEELPYVVI